MNTYHIGAVCAALTLQCFGLPADTVRTYITAIYSNSEVDIAKVCHAHPDLWMIPGKKDPEAIKEVAKAKIEIQDPGVFANPIGLDLICTEIRDGKIDPSFTLAGIYTLHRQLILRFLVASLIRDDRMEQFVTNPKNLDFGDSHKVADGDMDVYVSVIEALPILRVGNPNQDAENKSVKYRLPLGTNGYELKLVKVGSTWKIDTSTKTSVPLGFFFK